MGAAGVAIALGLAPLFAELASVEAASMGAEPGMGVGSVGGGGIVNPFGQAVGGDRGLSSLGFYRASWRIPRGAPVSSSPALPWASSTRQVAMP